MIKLSNVTHELLTESVRGLLSKRRINTTMTFVETNSELLAKISGLQFRQVIQVKNHILSHFSSKIQNGADAYDEFLLKDAIIPVGIESMDRLLDGGFMTGSIYEFCGSSSSGKSQLCFAIAANVSQSFKQNVFYIDTKGDFTASRLCNFLEKKTKKVGQALQRIKVVQPSNAYDLLNSLYDYVNQVATNKTMAAKLIIIDSLAAVFYQFIGAFKEGNSLLSSVSSILQYIARQTHAVIIVTNLVTNWQNSDSEEVQRASLGKFWSHIPNTRINFNRSNSSNVLLTVTKSSYLPLGSSVTITIEEDSIH